MREIDNNINNVNFKGVQKPLQDEKVQTEQPSAPVAQQEQKEIKDLKNMPAAELGKSQVATAIDNDMKFFTKHPEAAKSINEAIEKYAQNHTEEETLKFIDTALNEFAAK